MAPLKYVKCFYLSFFLSFEIQSLESESLQSDFFFLGNFIFFLSRPRQKIKIGKNKREFLIYEKMEKRLEDEIDEIVEKEIQNVRKSAEKYQLGNIYFYQLGDVNMETFKLMLVSKLPNVAKLNFLRYSEHFRVILYLILGK